MEGFPKIETQRLLLSELASNDIPRIVKYASNQKISDYTLNIPHPYTEKDAIYWLNLATQGFKNGTNIIFGIRLKPENELIGGIGLTIERKFHRAELGYWMGEPFWNKGYVTEASRSLIDYGFDQMKLNKITSSYLTENPASGKVMQKCGMIKEGELKEHIFKNNVYHDLVLYGITIGQYQELIK